MSNTCFHHFPMIFKRIPCGYNFAGHYTTGGCYSYTSGQCYGMAFYGLLPSGEIKFEYQLNPVKASQYRLEGTDHCQATQCVSTCMVLFPGAGERRFGPGVFRGDLQGLPVTSRTSKGSKTAGHLLINRLLRAQGSRLKVRCAWCDAHAQEMGRKLFNSGAPRAHLSWP